MDRQVAKDENLSYTINMKNDVQKSEKIIKKLAEKYRLNLVLLFGSQAKGKVHALSDTDIAFRSELPMRPLETAKMQIEFSQKLKTKDLEMIDLRHASSLLLKQVAENSILLYEKEHSLYARFKMFAYKQYMEAKPILELRRIQLNNFLKPHVG